MIVNMDPRLERLMVPADLPVRTPGEFCGWCGVRGGHVDDCRNAPPGT